MLGGTTPYQKPARQVGDRQKERVKRERICLFYKLLTADAIRVGNEHWEEIDESRLEQARNIDCIKAEVQGMVNSCNVQIYFNMTIKNG